MRVDRQVEGRHHHVTVGSHNGHILDDDGAIGALGDDACEGRFTDGLLVCVMCILLLS